MGPAGSPNDLHKLRPGYAGLIPEQWSDLFASVYAEGAQVEGRQLHAPVRPVRRGRDKTACLAI